MAEQGLDVELRESRFTYLLQPIRDLAANWDINIAGELEEYLEELEALTFAIEGTGTSLNFAEAALLIQGTTCVYSKKVEHLHNLVYQALETIMSKRQKEKAATRSSQDKAAAGAAAAMYDMEAFLCLDDVLQEADDIDMPEEEELEEGAGAAEALRPPTALLALEDAAAGQGEGDAGSFRLAQCSVHASGALLLELKDGDIYDARLRCMLRLPAPPPAGSSAANAGGGEAPHARGGEGGAPDAWLDDGCDGGDYGGGGDDDGYGDIDLPDAAADGGGAAPPRHATDVPEWLALAEQRQGAVAAGLMSQALEALPHEGEAGLEALPRRQQQPQEQQEPVFFDPYQPLDYADTKGLPLRPLKVRKPRKRDGARAPHKAGWARVHEPRLSEAAALLNFAEFAAGLDALLAAQRAAQPRPSAAAARHAVRRDAPRARAMPVMDWADAAAAAAAAAQGDSWKQHPMGGGSGAADEWGAHLDGAGYDGADGDDWGGGDAYGGYADDGSEGGAAEGLDPGLAAEMEDAVVAGALGRVGDAHMLRPLGGGEPADASALSYEDLCRSHIDALITAAAAQQVQTELQVRVSTWRQRIDPILRAEEERSAFDIHSYGERILSQLGRLALAPADEGGDAGDAAVAWGADGTAPAVAFAQVASTCASPPEVSRTFAAMLQLINNCNVKLCGGSGGRRAGSPDQPFELQLVSAHMHHKQFQEVAGAGRGSCTAAAAPPPRGKGSAASWEGEADAAGPENRRGSQKHTAKRARKGGKAAAA